MRILIVTNTYLPHLNGQAVFAGSLAEGLVEAGHQVKVLTPGIDREERQLINGVEIIGTPAVDLRFIHKEFFISWQYRTVVNEVFESYRPEIIHIQDPAPLSQMVLKEARKHHIPVICTHHMGPAIWAPYLSEHDPVVKYMIVPVIWAWVISFLNQADYVTVPSQASVRMLLQHGLKVPAKSISCGVSVQQFKETQPKTRPIDFHLDPSKKKFLYVGRIDEEKRVDVLVNALPYICHKDVEVVVAGGGSLETEMLKLTDDLHAQSKVQFLGKINHNNLPDLYRACDVFVMPGDVESLSIATLEAMACGKPVIAADAMALPELVKNDKNGYLFTPKNPQDLAGKIDRMCSMENLWSEMGKTSQAVAQSHDLKYTISGYQDLYQKMIRENLSKRHIPVWVRLPLSLVNPYALLVFGQWMATAIVVLFTLFSRNTPVSAMPLSGVDLIPPEMERTIQEFMFAIHRLNLVPNQAAGMISVNNGFRSFWTLLKPLIN